MLKKPALHPDTSQHPVNVRLPLPAPYATTGRTLIMAKLKSKAGTRIRAEVIRLVGLIPQGKFTTYGSIAVHMNVVALHVGSVMSNLTEEESTTIPWHRVVGADARIASKMGPELAKVQRGRLESEGLKIDKRGFILDADAHFHVVGIRRNIRWSESSQSGL